MRCCQSFRARGACSPGCEAPPYFVDGLASSCGVRTLGSSPFNPRNALDSSGYKEHEKASALLAQLPWTHHVIILGQSKSPEERELLRASCAQPFGFTRLSAIPGREFYIRLAVQEKWSSRELERQLRGALFERAVLNPPKVSAVLRQMPPEALSVFKRLVIEPAFGSRPDVPLLTRHQHRASPKFFPRSGAQETLGCSR